MTSGKDIANLANVSIATVSHVINNTRFVNPKTKKKVLDAMEKLSYRPNFLARALVTGKSKTIGLIISDIGNPYYSEIFKGVENYSANKGYNVFLANSDHDINKSLEAIIALLKKKVDGLLILSEIDSRIIQELLNSKVCFVAVNWTDEIVNTDTIYLDYKVGMKEAVDYIIKIGHKRIGFISGPKNNLIAKPRINIFNDLMKEYAGYNIKYKIFEGDHRILGGLRVSKEILEDDSLKPTVLICSNDLTAIGIINGLQNAGLKIPKNISVIGLDNILFTRFTNPPLSTIAFDICEIGEKATQLLLSRIDDKNKPIEQLAFKTKFIMRKSIAKPYS